jgi:hypothetical protein
MVEGNITKRHIAEKVSLLVIFIISLLAAWLVITFRSGIRLSAPIELNQSGLSVSLPSGGGWQCERQWKYDDTGFTISSAFAVGAGTNQSYTRCRYLLASRQLTPEERFGEVSAGIGREVVKMGRTTTGPFVVDWAKITGDAGFEMMFGVCSLPAGRELEIEVLQTADEDGLAESIFERIVKNIRFSDNGLLQAGEDIAREVRGSAPDTESQPVSFFILTDARGQVIGFTMDAITVQKDKDPAIKAASYYYIRGGSAPEEEVGIFSGDKTLSKFAWKIESSSRAGSKGIEMTADANTMVVRFAAGRQAGKESKYTLGEAAVPNTILDLALNKMLDSTRQQIIIDLIRPDGTITPMLIEKLEPVKKTAQARQDEQPANYALRTEILDGRGHWQKIYYDGNKQMTRVLLGQGNTYTLGRADANEITKMFPERADLVRNQRQLLDRDGL